MTGSSLKYLLTTSLGFFLTLSVVAAFNYKFDPAYLFHSGAEQEIAKLLLSGKNIENAANWDDRLIQKYIIEGQTKRHDVVVFGTSRSLRIGRDNFPKRTFFNHSVVGGTLEDYIALYQLLKENNKLPRILMIDLEPYQMNRSNAKWGWRTLEQEFLRAAHEMDIEPNLQHLSLADRTSSNKYLQLISLAYLKESFSKWRNREDGRDYQITDKEFGVNAVKLSDGSRNYGTEQRTRSREAVLSFAINEAKKKHMYAMEGFKEIDPTIQEAFETFLIRALNDGVYVRFYIPPYHPKTYEIAMTNERHKVMVDIEAYYRQVADKLQIPVVGSYNPAENGCLDTEFYDEVHPSDSCVKKVLRHKPWRL